ncbi:hypothetical protein D3C72_2057770 [compost metagenome]
MFEPRCIRSTCRKEEVRKVASGGTITSDGSSTALSNTTAGMKPSPKTLAWATASGVRSTVTAKVRTLARIRPKVTYCRRMCLRALRS